MLKQSSIRASFAPSTEQKASTWDRVIVVSNRLPFKYLIRPDGSVALKPSAGGLVTALSPLLHRGIRGKWIGWLGGDQEGLEEALRSLADTESNAYELGPVSLSEEVVRAYYAGYANQVLVPLLVDAGQRPDIGIANACWQTYQRVQRIFADEIARDIQNSDIIWVHDYHLIGVGRELRQRHITQPVGFFLHTPFPPSTAFGVLPAYQVRALLTSLLAYDLLGFQTRAFRDEFVRTITRYVPEARVSWRDGETTISYRGHVVRVGSFPISIDADAFERQLFADKTQSYIRRLDRVVRKDPELQILFDAGRQDYAKGFREELLALDILLTEHPEFTDKVLLIQLIIPSRTDIDAYRSYMLEVRMLANEINRRHGRKIVRQIHASMGTARYLAHLHVANVQSIPTLSDGMNLIVKESAIVGHKTTVIILGKAAGAAEELGRHALLADPSDANEYARTMYRALTMRLRERRHRKSQLKGIVTMHDVFDWWSEGVEPAFQRIWNASARD